MWPFKKKQEQIIEVKKHDIDTSLDGKWLQYKQPHLFLRTEYQLTPDRVSYVLNKNGDPTLIKKVFSDMYIKFFSPTEYEVIGIILFPTKKLFYNGKAYITGDYASPHFNKAKTTKDYEIVFNTKLINKLDCVVRRFYKDAKKKEDDVSGEILKASLAHRCEE
jgi:hypothetical protein